MAETHLPAVSLEVEPEQHGPRRFRRAQNAHRRLGDDAELAFRSDQQPEQVVARLIEMAPADLDDAAVHQHHLDAENIVGGDAVFQAVRAARVHGDVAGQRAGELAGGVGRVEKAASAAQPR